MKVFSNLDVDKIYSNAEMLKELAEEKERRNAMPWCNDCNSYHEENKHIAKILPRPTTPESALESVRSAILQEREKEYGSFAAVARISQKLKSVFKTEKNPKIAFTDVQAESLNMVCTKLARLSQNPNHKDSLVDVKGYIDLWLEELEKMK